MTLNEQQAATIAEYSGEVVSVSRKAGEYSDESQITGYAAIVTLSSGWVVTVGRYGAVLAEEQLPVPGHVLTTAIRPGVTDVRTIGQHEAVTDHTRVLEDGRHCGYAVQYSAPIGPELPSPRTSTEESADMTNIHPPTWTPEHLSPSITRCDAQRAGYVVGSCSDDDVVVWHGMSDPAHACGRHATYDLQAVFTGHRNRVNVAARYAS